MDVKGHPRKPLECESLPMASLVDSFLAETAVEDPPLHGYLEKLDDEGRRLLAGVLGRFDQKGHGALDPSQRLLARRVLSRLRRPDREILALANRVLDYLDLNRNALLEESELELTIEIMELFSHIETDNDTLSGRELEMLYVVLRHVDTNDNGVIDAHEKTHLRQGLDDPVAFLAEQRAQNPELKKILDER
ncbi:MAG: hypothetical protein JRF63_07885 [Deltaproteobacteria bacterium]|nr:hypothetical protein [Deltaproteobacteria bacterium]